jgi:hypothetical protein
MKPRLTIRPGAIYAARRTPQILALPKDRSSDFCQQSCYAQRNGDHSICDAASACWARSIGGSSATTVYATRRLEVERGRTPAPRPRSIHDVILERRPR